MRSIRAQLESALAAIGQPVVEDNDDNVIRIKLDRPEDKEEDADATAADDTTTPLDADSDATADTVELNDDADDRNVAARLDSLEKKLDAFIDALTGDGDVTVKDDVDTDGDGEKDDTDITIKVEEDNTDAGELGVAPEDVKDDLSFDSADTGTTVADTEEDDLSTHDDVDTSDVDYDAVIGTDESLSLEEGIIAAMTYGEYTNPAYKALIDKIIGVETADEAGH